MYNKLIFANDLVNITEGCNGSGKQKITTVNKYTTSGSNKDCRM